MSGYEWVYIIEATFRGKVQGNRMDIEPPIKLRTLDICEKQNYPDQHIDGQPLSTGRAKCTINDLWMFDGLPIKDYEWEDISIKFVNVADTKPSALMEVLTFEEIDAVWTHFCDRQSHAPDGARKKHITKVAINTGKARHALLKEAWRTKGYGGGQ